MPFLLHRFYSRFFVLTWYFFLDTSCICFTKPRCFALGRSYNDVSSTMCRYKFWSSESFCSGKLQYILMNLSWLMWLACRISPLLFFISLHLINFDGSPGRSFICISVYLYRFQGLLTLVSAMTLSYPIVLCLPLKMLYLSYEVWVFLNAPFSPFLSLEIFACWKNVKGHSQK